MDLLNNRGQRGTARGFRSFRTCTTTRMQLEAHSVPCKEYCASGLQHLICTEDEPGVRRTLQSLQVCSRDTIASSTLSNPQNECQLVAVLDSLLAASICCRRHRFNAVIHACLEGRFELWRPSVRGMPSFITHREGLLLRVGSLPCVPTYNHRGVVQHVVFDRFGLAQPHECSSKSVTCHAKSTAVQAASNII